MKHATDEEIDKLSQDLEQDDIENAVHEDIWDHSIRTRISRVRKRPLRSVSKDELIKMDYKINDVVAEGNEIAPYPDLF